MPSLLAPNLYAFRLFPPLFLSDPVACPSAASPPFAASTAFSSSGLSSNIFCDALLTRLGSALPTAGMDEARNSWNGATTNRPVSSNHSVKERESSKVSENSSLPDLLRATAILRR